uniref:NB-ARC domains-containing protein n=1 Tax=Tanacetum cinerariifolium TaxID=118510 RepID=A0A6L2KJI9_TANCI|nr:NB-ARC domains-containing protein [Tanacetum cinerariifolium]
MAIITSVAEIVVVSLVDVATRKISNIWNYTENVEKLKNETEKLKIMRGAVQQQIDSATLKADSLLNGVQEWVDKVDTDITKAEEFLGKANLSCFGMCCSNWCTLFHYGKTATEMYTSLMEHQVNGKGYESCVSVPTLAPGRFDVYENKNLDDIFTQNSCLEDIMTAIEDESKQIIGIYGIGGVGKTTLAMEASARVKHLFAEVAFTSVSQTINAEKIQKDLEVARKRIVKGEKVLVILDDVWEKLDLQELCIPWGTNYKNCKILLTSRSEDVCEKMNAHSICVNVLQENEAWILFKRMVGEQVDVDADLKRIAVKVAEECGGLPLFLNAVGNALKTKSIEEWDKALTRLQEHSPARIDREIGKAFTRLKLSYDFLEDDEAQSCFLLCGLFREDEEIDLEYLVYLAVGLGKFHGLKSIEDARQRVQDAVKILTSSGLLLNGYKGYIKLHDVVRDVVLLIASEGNNNFLVKAGKGLTEWLPRDNELECYTGISLTYNKICKLPNYELRLPHLETFLIYRKNELPMFSDELIKGMKEVRVFDMSCCKDQPLPQSFKFLTKLRMLDLHGNKSLHDISILGEMKELEILIVRDTGIKEIPQEIGQLVNLRRLDARNCKKLSHVVPGVISKLWRLEELCIGFMWVREGVCDRIVEVINLLNLTYLALRVARYDVIPEGFNPRNLNGFVIQVGGDFEYYFDANIKRRHLAITAVYVEIPFLKLLKQLIETSHSTDLNSITNLNNILPQLYHEGFNELEQILLDNCPNVSCLVDAANWDEWHTMNSSKHVGEGNIMEKFFEKLKHLDLNMLHCMEVLWKCPDQYVSLSNLVTLQICSCGKLVKVFPMSVAQGLVNLQNLDIQSNRSLKEVIWDGDEETEYIAFRSLSWITLWDLKRLERFYSGYSTIKYPSLVDVDIFRCKSLEMWGPGIHETPKLKFLGNVPLDGPESINDAVAQSYGGRV